MGKESTKIQASTSAESFHKDLKLTSISDLRHLAGTLPTRTENWVITDWSPNHVCGNKEFFTEIFKLDAKMPKKIKITPETLVEPRAIGTIILQVKLAQNWGVIHLRDVLYVPGACNVASLEALKTKKYTLKESKGYLKHETDVNLNISIKKKKNSIFLKSKPVEKCSLGKTVPEIQLNMVFSFTEVCLLWHLRLGHMNADSMRLLIESKVLKVDASEPLNFNCNWCAEHQHELLKKKISEPPETVGLLGKIIVVTAMKHSEVSASGSKYFILLEEKSTGFCWGISSKTVEDAVSQIFDFVSNFPVLHRTNIEGLDLSNITERQLMEKIERNCKKRNIKFISPVYDPLNNWEVYTQMQNVWNLTLYCLRGADLPLYLWDQLIQTSLFLHNIMPTHGISSYEKLFSKKPTLENLKVLGSPALLLPVVKKTPSTCVLVGSTNEGIHTLFHTTTKKINVSKSALVFEEKSLILNYNTVAILEVSDSKLSTPPTELAGNQNILNDFLSQDIMALNDTFKSMEQAGFSNYNELLRILQPYRQAIKCFEVECQCATPYTNTAHLTRSKTFEPYELSIKKEFEPLETKPDGDCQYHAVSLSLFGNQSTSLQMRMLLLLHVLDNWELLKNNCLQIFHKKLEEVVKEFVCLDLWATETTSFILSEVINRPIYVVQIHHPSLVVQPTFYNSNPENEKKPPVYILLHNHHFEALVPKSKTNVSTISRLKSANLYIHVSHKYIFNGNLDMRQSFLLVEYETAARIRCYPDLTDEIEKMLPNVASVSAKKSIPTITLTDSPRHELTDDENEEAEKIFSCLNCKKTNNRLRELYAREASLRKELRKKISSDIHAQNIPIIKCDSCTNLDLRLRKLEEEKNQIIFRQNVHGAALIGKIEELKSIIANLRTQQKNLQQGHGRLFETLEQRNQEKRLLERQLVVLAENLEQYQRLNNSNSPLPLVDGPSKKNDSEKSKEASKHSQSASASPTGSDRSRNSAASRIATPPESATINALLDAVEKMENQQKSQADHKVLGSMIDDFVTSALKKYAKSSHCRDNFDLLHHDLDLSESETSEREVDSPKNISAKNPLRTKKNAAEPSLRPDTDLSEPEKFESDAYENCKPKPISTKKKIQAVRQDLYLSSQSEEESESDKNRHLRDKNPSFLGIDDSDVETEPDSHSDISIEEILESAKAFCILLGIDPPKMQSQKGKEMDPRKQTHTVTFNIGGKKVSKTYDFPYKFPPPNESCSTRVSTDNDTKNKNPSKGHKKPIAPQKSKTKPSSGLLSRASTEPRLIGSKAATSTTQSNEPSSMRFRASIRSNDSPIPSTSHQPKSRKVKPAAKKKAQNHDSDDEGERYQCPKCSNSYKYKCSMTRHLESHEQSRYPCPWCTKTFRRHEYFKKHVYRFHSGDRTQICRFCSHTLKKSAQAMRTHEISHHLNLFLAAGEIEDTESSEPETQTDQEGSDN